MLQARSEHLSRFGYDGLAEQAAEQAAEVDGQALTRIIRADLFA